MTQSIQSLRTDYEELIGKRPFPGWSSEKLEEKMNEYKSDNNINEVIITKPTVSNVKIDLIEEKSIEAHSARHEANEKIRRSKIYRQLFGIEPVYIKGKPFAIIENEYVEWDKAQLIALQKVKKEVESLIKEQEINVK